MPSPFLLADNDYPAALKALASPPTELWLSSALPTGPMIAIVGTRNPTPEAEAYARELARAVAATGAVVVSGGALGIDSAAHRGALEAGGKTCVVLPTGHTRVYPPNNAELFDAVREAGGTLVWPFKADATPARARFYVRNAILVALSSAVVIVQAGLPSGALNAAAHARRLGRPIFAVAAPPWVTGFEGSTALLGQGATAIVSTGQLLRDLGLTTKAGSDRPSSDAQMSLMPRFEERYSSRTGAERSLLDATRDVPRHMDELRELTSLSASTLSTALLTLCLEHVLVEGPDGLFRWNIP